jgi:hypothetical protein
MHARVHWPGFITLLFLSPIVAELLSGSAPPVEFFSPFGLLILVTWYGFGAILCRELSIRWQGGLAGLFLLGAAFGILEEGILIKTFFDPQAVDLGIFQTFGWWGGANWPWILELTLYHALVSITLPVLVVASLWPEQRVRPWISRRAILALLGIMAIMALLDWFFLSPAGAWPPYLPGLGQFLGSLAAIAALVWLARRIKHKATTSTLTRRWPLFLVGVGWGLWILGVWLISDSTHSTPLTLLWTAGMAASLLGFSYVRLRALDRTALVGAGTLAAGTWFFWSLLSFIQELDNANRPDNTSGMALVGPVGLAAMAVYLVYLARQWRKLRPHSITHPSSPIQT